ncbi:hypothetical protein FRB91_006339 [Serendipita sp. 411]|nr:hypothetical protein FRB91_006339 [Serendipita sp. 411]
MHSGVVEGKVEGGKLLHTLAARALIQAFEDLPKTPRSKAEIERLGKRYSLASSVTSFVAIGDTVETEPVEPLPTLFGQWTGVTPARGRPNLADQLQLALNQRTSKLAIDSDDDGEWDEVAEADEESSSEDDRSSRSALATSLFSGAVDPVLPPLIPQPTGMPAQYAGSLRLEREAEKVRSIRRRPPPPPPRLARASSSAPAPAPAAPRTTSNATCGPSFSFAMSTQSPGGSKPAAGNEPWKVLSVEWIARTQRFDGSFPSNKEHFVFLFKGDETLATSALESLPSALLLLFNGNNAEDGLEEKSKGKNREVTRMTIWATVVTLMCLETRFAEEKSAWELLAEKAREFIKSVLLHSLGLEEAKAREALVQFESSAIPLFEQKATTKRSKEDDFLSFWLD